MLSYSFGQFNGVSEIPEGVLGLFKELAHNTEKHVEFTGEIVSNAIMGRINTDARFSIDAYEYGIRRNQRINRSRKSKREVAIDYSDINEDWEADTVKVDVASSRNVKRMQDAYEQLMDGEELKIAIQAIKEIQPVLLLEEKVDIVFLIKQALRGIPSSVKRVCSLCEAYEDLADSIRIILEHGQENLEWC